jgi:hypothetical protein
VLHLSSGSSVIFSGASSATTFGFDGGNFELLLADSFSPSAQLKIASFWGGVVTVPGVQSADVSGWTQGGSGKLVGQELRVVTVHTAPETSWFSSDAAGVGAIDAPSGLQVHLVGTGLIDAVQLPGSQNLDVFVEESVTVQGNLPANVRSIVVTSDRGVSLRVGIGSNDTALVDLRSGGVIDASQSGAGSRVLGGTGGAQVTGGPGFDSFTFGSGDNYFGDRAVDFTATTAVQLIAAADDIIGWGTATYSSFGVQGDRNVAADQRAPAHAGLAHIESGAASFDPADTTLAQKLDAVAAAVSANLHVAYFFDAGNAYVFVSNGSAGINPGDVLVRLVGVTDPSLFVFSEGGLYHGTQG